MAYRRKQGITKASALEGEIHRPAQDMDGKNRSSSPPSLRESSAFDQPRSKGFTAYENESKGFWDVLALKAKTILDDGKASQQSGSKSSTDGSTSVQSPQSYISNEGFRKMDNPRLRRGLDKLTSSLNQIGDSFEKAFEEGRTIVESKTSDIIQGTRKLQIRRRGTGSDVQNQDSGVTTSWQKSPAQPIQLNQTEQETQLKASRDVAMATAAKAKLLFRELKTNKADLAFAKERCAQLEEENKHLRESHEKGSNPADDDLVRLQLESLLAEKARLAHENSIYARENRFLMEIVEYHQLTMQDVVYIDEGIAEVSEVYPSITMALSVTSSSPLSPPSPFELLENHPAPDQHPQEKDNDAPGNDTPPSSICSVPDQNDVKRPPKPSA